MRNNSVKLFWIWRWNRFWSSGSPPVWCSRTIYDILIEGIMGNIHVKLYEICTSGSGGDVIWRHFLSRALAAPLFSGLKPFVQYWKKASWETTLWDYFEFGPVVQEEMPFKGISYLELWQPFCSAEYNHLCNFGRGYQEEQFCEIILNLGQWFRRRYLLKDFLSGHHGEHSCEVIWN